MKLIIENLDILGDRQRELAVIKKLVNARVTGRDYTEDITDALLDSRVRALYDKEHHDEVRKYAQFIAGNQPLKKYAEHWISGHKFNKTKPPEDYVDILARDITNDHAQDNVGGFQSMTNP